jgi:hypothetical protein
MPLLCLALAVVLTSGCVNSDSTEPPAAKHAPATVQEAKPDRDLILNAILRDVLLDKFLERLRADYNPAGVNEIVLVSSSNHGIPWPEDYRPALPAGYAPRRMEEGVAHRKQDGPRLLGIRIDKLDLEPKEEEPFREPISVTLMGVGGKDCIADACSVYYVLVRKENGWTVQCTRIMG